MAGNNCKLVEPIKVCEEQFCMDRERDKLGRHHQELLDWWDYKENADTSRQNLK